MQQASSTLLSSPTQREIHFQGSTENVRVTLMSDDPGVVEFSGSAQAIVSIHVGPSAFMTCRRAGISHSGSAVHGDIDIIPPGLRGTWELKERDTALVVSLGPALVNRAVEDLDADPSRLEIRNRFQARDARLEHISWALKAEMETGCSGGRLYMDSLAAAMACQLVASHSSLQRFSNFQGGFSTRKLKQVLSYIEDNLSEDLSLQAIADVAGLSVSHCKVLFRKTVGMPVHQYVIRRRVDRAAALLRRGNLPVSQVALETGFSHQSHLAAHMRRVLGVSPKTLRK